MSRPSTWHARLARVQSGELRGAGGSLARALLGVLAFCYRGGRGLHRALYRCGLRRRVRLPRPVLSVGNLTAGGAGKTPLIEWLSQRFRATGLAPVVLAPVAPLAPVVLAPVAPLLAPVAPVVPPVVVLAPVVLAVPVVLVVLLVGMQSGAPFAQSLSVMVCSVALSGSLSPPEHAKALPNVAPNTTMV